MIPKENNLSVLLSQISESDLYIQLINQIKKDFELVGQAIDINEFITPNDLIKEMHLQIHHLLKDNFDTFLQLLYRVDVSESSINFNMLNSDIIAQEVTFSILQREWGKVKLRAKFK